MKTITDTLEISRSNQHDQRKARTRYHKPDDEKDLSLIKSLTDQRPTWGYRRVCALLNRSLVNKGQPRVNHKRVYRLMKLHHLLLQKHTGRPIRLHEGTVITLKSNMRWCSDMFEIPCWNGQKVRVVFALDCSDREVLSYLATTGGISGEMVRDVMALAIENRFGSGAKPHVIQWLSDNGSAYTAYETQSFARFIGLDPAQPLTIVLSLTGWPNPSLRPSNGTTWPCIILILPKGLWNSFLPGSRTITSIIPTRGLK